jgi:transposase
VACLTLRLRGLVGFLNAGRRDVEIVAPLMVGIDFAEARDAILIVEGGRRGEAQFFGQVEAVLNNMRRIVRRIEWTYDRVEFCYKAGPACYRLHRMIVLLTYRCLVVAPSLIPSKPDDQVKTDATPWPWPADE